MIYTGSQQLLSQSFSLPGNTYGKKQFAVGGVSDISNLTF